VAATATLDYFFEAAPARAEMTTALRVVTLIAMLVTALIGSELSLRAQRRAHEAERRREEMQRLHALTSRLVGAQSVAQVAGAASQAVVDLFSLRRAVFRTPAGEFACPSGAPPDGNPSSIISVPLPPRNGSRGGAAHRDSHANGPAYNNASLELFGPAPSAEVANALSNFLGLAIDRAMSFEQQTRAEAVRRGEELRTTILNAVAHDFRTPLTSIKAAATALRASSAAIFEQDRELVDVINEEADRLESLIRESLVVARLEEFADARREPCSIPEILTRVKTRLARRLDRRRVETEIPEDLPAIPGDRFLLELMFFQVVENAWKYSAPGAQIVIEAKEESNSVSVSVWNEGLRIPDYEKNRIFDKFYRGSIARGRTEGSGLGLAIARSIAEAHHGSITLYETENGTGFRFLLPLAEGTEDVSAQNYSAGR
jgi:two-component system sensor histidine kinase KdpD